MVKFIIFQADIIITNEAGGLDIYTILKVDILIK